jgi:BirA family transcriptional regulator, biotin operon repressor / biotin---[acetyl-CoA-carboxylase] ligase
LFKIKDKLQATPNRIGSRLISLHQVDSTNNYATGLAHAGMAQHGLVVTAKEQTAGKGQRNRTWKAAPGENITMSVVIEPDLEIHQAFLLSKTVSAAVHKFFSAFAGEEVKIKWPNDIYWNDRKAGGILIENIISGGKWKWAIAGIGININQQKFEELSTKPVSLIQITGRTFDLSVMQNGLCEELGTMYQTMLSDVNQIECYYQQHLFMLNREARFRKDNRVFSARIKSVNAMGELVVEHGTEERFAVGEVEWII